MAILHNTKTANTDLSWVFNQLMSEYSTLRQSLDDMYNHSQSIRMLSFNTSIEAARAGAAGSGFRVIAGEIKKYAETSDGVNQKCGLVVNEIEKEMHQMIGIRTADIAFDVIDKIDRNLFERFCDVQAWATFAKIIEALANQNPDTCREAQKIISNLVRIYEVYHDIFLADTSGTIIAAGVNTDLKGTDVADKAWFTDVLKTGQTVVSDMYFSETLHSYTVAYSSPVTAADGTVLGVLTTRFNWDYIYDIVDKAKISPDSEIYVINRNAEIIASKRRADIFTKDVRHNPAVINLANGIPYGYSTEMSLNNKLTVFGYAVTQGYNAYKGKGWSVVVGEQF